VPDARASLQPLHNRLLDMAVARSFKGRVQECVQDGAPRPTAPRAAKAYTCGKMPEFKDLFSLQAADYAQFRPVYPEALFSWVAAQAPGRGLAVDVGAGNGQASVALATHFQRVLAVEPSAAQLASAPRVDRVEYRVGSAEVTGAEDGSADLLAAAQAFHWFRPEPFYAEVRRVLRPGGCLALWCYGMTHVTPEIDAAIFALYEGLLGSYWEPERRLVEQGYATVTVPFTELTAPRFNISVDWTLEHLLGYLSTWSALRRYQMEHGDGADGPLLAAFRDIALAWGDVPSRTVLWPLSLRAFRV
jgi:SAM-dependent methyltransferase